MARQLCGRGMRNFFLLSDCQQRNYSKAKFLSNLNCKKTFVKRAPAVCRSNALWWICSDIWSYLILVYSRINVDLQNGAAGGLRNIIITIQWNLLIARYFITQYHIEYDNDRSRVESRLRTYKRYPTLRYYGWVMECLLCLLRRKIGHVIKKDSPVAANRKFPAQYASEEQC